MKRYSFLSWAAGAATALSVVMLASAAETQAPAEPGPTTSGNLSVRASSKRAPWQAHMTLGPGDILNIQIFDMPETARTEVPVGPDGRLTFLQARDVMASGLTIDQLRAKLDETLAKIYQNARTVVIPVAYHSKKYFVLGAVTGKGVFNLDRPLTVIEAIARAGGLETGLYDQRTVELAD